MVNALHRGSSFDDFLQEEGIGESVNALAVKRVLAWQIEEAMRQKGMNKSDLARRMKTSRSAVNRLLDVHNASLSLASMEKAARALGKRLAIQLA